MRAAFGDRERTRTAADLSSSPHEEVRDVRRERGDVVFRLAARHDHSIGLTSR
jgi:hypothetical protein